jgi:hypothetical protein
MLRMILGVLAGFLVWSIIWVGSSTILMALSADYAKSMETMSFSIEMHVFALIRSFICSITAGWISVLVSKEFSKTTFCLGVLLLVFGLFVQVSVWDKLPVWYHVIFLSMLIPLTFAGGKLKKIETD